MIDPNKVILDAEHADRIISEQAAEIARLKEAIRRIAEQDATLSVQGGNVVVTMDATLTREERVALTFIAHNDPRDGFVRRTWLEFKVAICGLLERTK
jgi:hypothetical protein